MVTLRTGEEVPEVIVKSTVIALIMLLEKDFTAFYDLVELARNPEYEIWGPNLQILRSSSLITEPDDQPHRLVRLVILAATEGGGMEMTLVFPLPAPKPQ